MSSLEIAQLTGKDHSHVLRDIRNMLLELTGDTSGLSRFGSSYMNSQNKEQPCFELPKEETLCLMSGYDVRARMVIIKRWQELELFQVVPALPSYSEALRQLADQLDVTSKQSLQLEAQKPAVEFVERYIESTGKKGFRDVCKLLKAKENQFREFLLDQKIMYRLDGNLTPYGNHLDAGRFEVNAGISDTEHAYTQAKFTPKGINWVAGLWAVHNLKG